MSVVFDNSYLKLGPMFSVETAPQSVSSPRTIRVNEPVARLLGFDPAWLASPPGARFLAGNDLLPGSEPIAAAYAGHQFGSWNPRLGDGRAHLLGEIIATNGERFDLQLKGSGRTPFSRQGDGRSPLGPALREYVISEAMAGLGVPTTRALAVVATGETVRRTSPEPGGITARVAASHVRVGTFEYFASMGETEAVETLIDYVLDRHFSDSPVGTHPGLALIDNVASVQAELVAQWQLVGFIHGVMNTDNMAVSGETIDYGPCAFMNAYEPGTVYSSIDHWGRYAFGNQPAIAQWNLARLATAVLAATEAGEAEIDHAEQTVRRFEQELEKRYHRGLVRKIGLTSERESDILLATDLLDRMQAAEADYTLTFRQLSEAAAPDSAPQNAGELPQALHGWVRRWKRRIAQSDQTPAQARRQMEAINPAVIPRNHIVNEALAAAAAGDETPFHDLVDAVCTPFAWPTDMRYTRPPEAHERVEATFCGT